MSVINIYCLSDEMREKVVSTVVTCEPNEELLSYDEMTAMLADMGVIRGPEFQWDMEFEELARGHETGGYVHWCWGHDPKPEHLKYDPKEGF